MTARPMAITGRNGSTVEYSSEPVLGITGAASMAMWITPSTTVRAIAGHSRHEAKLPEQHVFRSGVRLCILHADAKRHAAADSTRQASVRYQGI